MNNKIKISIIGSRGYPYVYSGYETFVKELSERLVKKGCEVTIYCHKALFNERPKQLNGINLKTSAKISLSLFLNSFINYTLCAFLHLWRGGNQKREIFAIRIPSTGFIRSQCLSILILFSFNLPSSCLN